MPLAKAERQRLTLITTAESGVPASGWEVVASGRTGRARRLHRLGTADHAAIDHVISDVGEWLDSLFEGQDE